MYVCIFKVLITCTSSLTWWESLSCGEMSFAYLRRLRSSSMRGPMVNTAGRTKGSFSALMAWTSKVQLTGEISKIVQDWPGNIHAFFAIFISVIPNPVITKYSDALATLYMVRERERENVCVEDMDLFLFKLLEIFAIWQTLTTSYYLGFMQLSMKLLG